jgi:NADH:ubiquinone oxidoreductase subunit 6 (subunit J)
MAFALPVAITAGCIFLLFASVVDPVMAMLMGDTLFVGFWSLIDAIFAVDDPSFVVEGALTGMGRLFFTLLIAPPLFIALISEVIGARRALWYAGATGLLTAAVPWLLRGSPRMASPAELHVSLVLGLTGAVAGLVYWMIAGRSAGPKPPAPVSAPMPRGS